MTRLDVERTELRGFSCDVKQQTERTLDLLKTIESTLANLTRLSDKIGAEARFASTVIPQLDKISGVIDPDGAIQNSLENARSSTEELYNALIEKRDHGRRDGRLCDEDGIEDAYTEAIGCVADLNNILSELAWAIGEHDIDAAPVSRSRLYDVNEIDAMFEDMLK